MSNTSNIQFVFDILRKELVLENTESWANYLEPEKLIMVVLSCQTTGEQTTKAFNRLFKEDDAIGEIAFILSEDEIAGRIRCAGMATRKAKSIKQIACWCLDRPEPTLDLPKTFEGLQKFYGVGRKVASVFLGLCGENAFPVDTHVKRIGKRLDWGDNVSEIENSVRSIIPDNDLFYFSNMIISFGKSVCKARTPLCKNCKLTNICKAYLCKSSIPQNLTHLTSVK